MYGGLPGDIANAESKLVDCGKCNPPSASAGDGIIGDKEFGRTLKPQVIGKTHVPADTAADETILFWNHLLNTNFIGGVTNDGPKDGTEIAFGITMPEAKTGGGFIVGHSEGGPWPKSLSPYSTGFEGTILVQISPAVLQGKAELNETNKQPLAPLRAAQIDRKMDDGRPGTGYVQAYGAPGCFAGKDEGLVYNEASPSQDCGLIYLIDKESNGSLKPFPTGEVPTRDKQEFLTKEMSAAQKSPEAQKPKPFSSLDGDWFKKSMENYLDAMTPAPVTDVAGSGFMGLHSRGTPLMVVPNDLKIFDIANGYANTLTILAPGLARNNHLEIYADAGIDHIVLDGCLTWKSEKFDDQFNSWIATDENHATRKVRIPGDAAVEVEKSCNSLYSIRYMTDTFTKGMQGKDLRRKIRDYPDKAQYYSDTIDEEVYSRAMTGPYSYIGLIKVTKPDSYTPSATSDIAQYEDWVTGLATPAAKSRLGLVVDLMKQGKLPTEFLSWTGEFNAYTLDKLDFDPSSLSVLNLNDDERVNNCGHNSSVLVSIQANAHVECHAEKNIFFVSSGTSNDDIHLPWGDNAFFSLGAGDDKISNRWKRDIILLDENWGKKVVRKACSHARPENPVVLKSVKGAAPLVGGVGMHFGEHNGSLIIRDVVKGMPAEKAGLMPGDHIIKIDNMPVSELTYSAESRLLGEPGTKIQLTYKRGDKEETVQTERAPLGPEDKENLRIIDYKWPFTYTNFIIFGPGIKKEDITWESDHLLVNKRTGDSIEFLTAPCYNFVYYDN